MVCLKTARGKRKGLKGKIDAIQIYVESLNQYKNVKKSKVIF